MHAIFPEIKKQKNKNKDVLDVYYEAAENAAFFRAGNISEFAE